MRSSCCSSRQPTSARRAATRARAARAPSTRTPAAPRALSRAAAAPRAGLGEPNKVVPHRARASASLPAYSTVSVCLQRSVQAPARSIPAPGWATARAQAAPPPGAARAPACGACGSQAPAAARTSPGPCPRPPGAPAALAARPKPPSGAPKAAARSPLAPFPPAPTACRGARSAGRGGRGAGRTASGFHKKLRSSHRCAMKRSPGVRPSSKRTPHVSSTRRTYASRRSRTCGARPPPSPTGSSQYARPTCQQAPHAVRSPLRVE